MDRLTHSRIALTVSPTLDMTFPCSHCDRTFENGSARNHHHWSQHCPRILSTLDSKEYTVEWQNAKLHCPVDQCGRSYTSREAFLKHAKARHSSLSMASPSPVGSSQWTIRKQLCSSPSSRSKLYALLRSQDSFVSQRVR